MKKHTQLLSALALSVGLTLSAPFPALASIPGQVPGQATLPSLAPMLEKVLPAVVSVKVEGTATHRRSLKNSLARICQTSRPSRLKDSVRG